MVSMHSKEKTKSDKRRCLKTKLLVTFIQEKTFHITNIKTSSFYFNTTLVKHNNDQRRV